MAADYTLVNKDDVDSKGQLGEFKVLKNALNAQQVALSVRSFPAHSGQRGKGGHKHKQIEEVLYVTKGQLVIKLEDEEATVKAGDAMRIAAPVMRAYQNDSDEEAVIVIASPILPGGKSDAIHTEDFWKE